MDESIAKYELAATFLIAMLRLIYDGPKLFDGPLEVDEVTSLQAIALAMRVGQMAGQEPVTLETFGPRLRSITKHSEDTPRFDFRKEAIGWVTVCVSWPYSGRRICFEIYEPGSVLRALGEGESNGL